MALVDDGVQPGLAAVLVGEDEAAHIYVSTKQKACADVGCGELVGAPQSILRPQDAIRANATVTVSHVRPRGLATHTRRADILVAAAGVPGLITADMVKPGAVVVDVGVHRTDDGLIGDVRFDEVKEVAGMITPVPGGVGPMTVAMLLVNTVTAAELLTEKR